MKSLKLKSPPIFLEFSNLIPRFLNSKLFQSLAIDQETTLRNRSPLPTTAAEKADNPDPNPSPNPDCDHKIFPIPPQGESHLLRYSILGW
jgi:hypothetical protein